MVVSASVGRKSLFEGTRRTSSKVIPSPMIFSVCIDNLPCLSAIEGASIPESAAKVKINFEKDCQDEEI